MGRKKILGGQSLRSFVYANDFMQYTAERGILEGDERRRNVGHTLNATFCVQMMAARCTSYMYWRSRGEVKCISIGKYKTARSGIAIFMMSRTSMMSTALPPTTRGTPLRTRFLT